VVQALVAATTVVVAWRRRHRGPAVPIAAGIVGSLLFTPYVGFQDFAVLFVAGWLLLRAQPSDWQLGMLAAGVVVLELVLILNPAIILVLEMGVLVSLLRQGTATARGPGMRWAA
jgi:hypothetical protein